MTFSGRYRAALLFLGDIGIFALSLWLTLLARTGAFPTEDALLDHVPAFSILFVLWILVFYMAGLYGKNVVLFKSALFGTILRIQVTNIILAALFFFFTPGIGIAPKTNLVLYLIISLALIVVWRLVIFPRITRPSAHERAVLLGTGPEAEELMKEVNGNARYQLQFVFRADPSEVADGFSAFRQRLIDERITTLVVDTEQDLLRPILPRVYELCFISPGCQFLDFYEIYEEVFDRVPLSLLEYDWFLKNVSSSAPRFYPIAKRALDIAGGVCMGILTILLTPVVAFLMRLEGPGPIFIKQERIGRYGAPVTAYKFRSMRFSDAGKWKGEGENRVTKIGSILRRTSLDEFPQFLNVLKGDVSLIGPRNDMRALGERLGDAIPYYGIRYIVPPGITGWAQINQQYEQDNISPQSIEETKVRLAYDFYYIKNRSFALDLVIALKTLKRMLFRVSSW